QERAGQIGAFKTSHIHASAFKNAFRKVCASKIRPYKICVLQPSTLEVGAAFCRLHKTALLSAGKHCSFKRCLMKGCSRQMRSREVDTSKVRSIEDRMCKVSASHTEGGPRQRTVNRGAEFIFLFPLRKPCCHPQIYRRQH